MDNQGSEDVLLEEALDPSFLGKLLQPNLLLSKSKQELVNACLIVQRSSEELVLLVEEMRSALKYYSNLLNEVDILLEKFSVEPPSLYTRGAISLLRSFQKTTVLRMKICQDNFLPILSEQCTPFDLCSDNEDECESDYEDDDDDLF